MLTKLKESESAPQYALFCSFGPPEVVSGVSSSLYISTLVHFGVFYSSIPKKLFKKPEVSSRAVPCDESYHKGGANRQAGYVEVPPHLNFPHPACSG